MFRRLALAIVMTTASALLVLLILSAVRAQPQDTLSFDPLPASAITIANAGEICFDLCDECTELQATFFPGSCYSSSCTREIQRFGDVRVDEEGFAIRFTTRVVTVDPLGPEQHRCTADCLGLAAMRFYIGLVKRGTYAVWLGDERLGDLPVPPRSGTNEPLCFSSRAPEPPEPPDKPDPRATATPPSLDLESPLP